MKKRDMVFALLVVIIWGANFTVIKLGLEGVPSMLLIVLRYIATVFPAVFFIKRPEIPWRYLVAYGLTVGVGEFGCLFFSIEIGMPAGLASVVLQSQAFFTVLFAAVLLKEGLEGRQLAGLAVSAAGLYCIGAAAGTHGISGIPLEAIFLLLLGAGFFGFSNIIVRYASNQAVAQEKKLDMLSFVVWSSLVPPLPLLGMALLLDTPQTLIGSIRNLNGMSVFAIFFLAYCATLYCFGAWNALLAKYPAGMVAPLSLLVPVTGLITAQLVLGEHLSTIQWTGSVFILSGLVLSHLGPGSVKRLVRGTGEKAGTKC